MPTRALKLCSKHGPYAGRRCLDCQRRRLDQLSMRSPGPGGPSPYDDPAWRTLSAAFLKAHPFCQSSRHRFPVITPGAVVVDHVDGRGPGGPHGMDPDWLQALCRPCHSAKTNTHDGGLGNPRTPPDDPRRRL